jgi:hypothetical protein
MAGNLKSRKQSIDDAVSALAGDHTAEQLVQAWLADGWSRRQARVMIVEAVHQYTQSGKVSHHSASLAGRSGNDDSGMPVIGYQTYEANYEEKIAKGMPWWRHLYLLEIGFGRASKQVLIGVVLIALPLGVSFLDTASNPTPDHAAHHADSEDESNGQLLGTVGPCAACGSILFGIMFLASGILIGTVDNRRG